jgi:hypothetical protein
MQQGDRFSHPAEHQKAGIYIGIAEQYDMYQNKT